MVYVSETTAHLPLKVVIHDYPQGVDELVSAWAAMRVLGHNRPAVNLTFVRAGENLPTEECAGCEVIHIDTGRGEFDQHGHPEHSRTSSFELFAKHYKLDQDPGITPLLELTIKADNIEDIDPTSVHYLFKSRVKRYRNPETKEVDWKSYVQVCFEDLDDIYKFHSNKARAKAEFECALQANECQIKDLGNGLRVYWTGFMPNLREAAFDHGADVVVMMAKADRSFHPLIQCSRKSRVKLCRVNFDLRQEEVKARNISPKGINFWEEKVDPALGGAHWFLHHSNKLLCCGSRSHPLDSPEEFTKLRPFKIFNIVCHSLAQLPPR